MGAKRFDTPAIDRPHEFEDIDEWIMVIVPLLSKRSGVPSAK
jgi:hypothetical protein